MRWIAFSVALVIVVIIGNSWPSFQVSGNGDGSSGGLSSIDQADQSGSAGYGGNKTTRNPAVTDDGASVVSFNPTAASPDEAEASEKTDSTTIIIGSPKDPDDPASLILDDPEIIIVGEPKDPDDPASLILDDLETVSW